MVGGDVEVRGLVAAMPGCRRVIVAFVCPLGMVRMGSRYCLLCRITSAFWRFGPHSSITTHYVSRHCLLISTTR